MGTNTGIGIGIGIPFKNFSSGGRQPLPPDLKASLKGVWIAYGKSNNDADRSIVKNLVDLDNPFIISNAAFKLNSGFGKYEVDFTSWIQTNGVIASSDKVQNSITGHFLYFNTVNKKEDVPSFKVNITLGQQSKLQYNYIKEDGTTTYIVYSESGIYTIPASYFSKYTGVNAWFGFYQIEGTSIIEQIPSFEGAFVTDGIDDLITSTKTVQEMLGGSTEFTAVSMIHLISPGQDVGGVAYTNYIRTSDNYWTTNRVSNTDKTGIYGYSFKQGTPTVINNVLGDKNDYTTEKSNITSDGSVSDLFRANFSVEGFEHVINGAVHASSVAWYWTIIANKVLTTDQINQVIAYFNLDRTLKPDILCNITKQGITNDNHADFNDKLVDYSGNGRDIQMNNLAWKGGSGIAAKQYETFKDWLSESSSTSIIKQIDEFTRIVESTTNGYWVSRIIRDSDLDKVYDPINVYLYQDNNFLIHECKYEVDGVKYSIPIYESVGKGYHKLEIYTKDRYTELPENAEKVVLSEWYFPKSNKGSIKYSLIPSYKGGILLDGVNDFGKVTGMPVYKDYTIVVDYERISGREEALISKAYIVNQGAFVLMETSGTAKHSYSFGAYTAFNRDDFTRTLLYQSKYKCGDVNLTIGKGIDGDTLWLGTLRNNDYRFFNGAIYSLMSFPYSMSEFLIERQLKKHKLGTLYPDMVEFRPVINSNVLLDAKPTFVIRGTSTYLNAGDYVPENSQIWVSIKMNNAADRITKFTVNGKTINIPENAYSEVTLQYGFPFRIDSKSPQKINITIDEYIRFEDIVQPYPLFFEFTDENGNLISWGGKAKVGNTITRSKSVSNANILAGLYNTSNYKLNGKPLEGNSYVVEKQMVFTCTATYLFDNNEPKCILSPRLLRIPNSSYKILGHIPDISGHGNHGKINNSAYKLNSGVNGYLVDFTTLKDDGIKGIVRTDSKIYLDKSFNYNQGFWLGRTNNPSPAYKVKVSGIPETGMLTYTGGVWLNLVNGINELPARTNTEEEHGFVIQSPNLDWSNLVIEQIGEYEGAYCFDGVDDFVTIPTIVGGKQVLMKMNWQNRTGLLYDQRKNGSSIDAFAILNVNSNNSIAYNSRNTDGETYIDGILNKNIVCPQLYKITHSITIINQLANKEEVISPTIGSDTTHKIYFSQMSLYDFMLFDDISTEDKIKELNEYVGIEAKVELPPYYWDAYGKSNLDADRDTIQQRGVAVGDYDLTNTNFAYDKMSGFGGYEFTKFDNTSEWTNRNRKDGIKIIKKNGYSFTAKRIGTGQYFYDFQNRSTTVLNKSLTVKAVSNNNTCIRWEYKYRTAKKPDIDSTLLLVRQAMIPNVPITVALPYKTEQEKADLGVTEGSDSYLFYFDPSDIPVGEEYTVEMLPLYPNGLLYDAVTDYSENVNIPVFTDFTAIMKRKWLKNQGCPLIKGSKVYEGGNGNALLFEWDKAYNFVFYKRTDIMEREVPENISFITPTNYNGNVITRGSGQDTNGICIAGDGNAGFANIVFYKLILYHKTIPLLQINFLKNLMERDEIIDLNNPIFIKNE